MTGNINIENRSDRLTEIDIEGVIGVPEEWQFDNPAEKTATYERFKTQIEAIRNIASGRVVVNIRSTGGNVNDALLIYDTLCGLKTEVTTRCYGYVASAATLIAQAASPGRREMSENSLYLIHQSVSAAEGNKQSLSQTIDLLGKTDQRIAAIYASRSGKPISDFIALMNHNNGNGRWLTAQEAQEAGLIDRITTAATLSNSALEQVKSLRLPQPPSLTQSSSQIDALQNNQKQPEMNLKKQWLEILNLLGMNPEKENSITETQLEQLNEELSSRARTIVSLQQEGVENSVDPAVEALQNRIGELEAQNAKLNAKATQTKPKEDPAASESKLSPNAQAYREDIANFR